MADQAQTALVQLGAEERALLTGDLGKLSQEQRSKLFFAVCESVGLNPLTRPFEYVTLNGRLVLYAKKDATDQLRALRGISITCSKPEIVNDVLYVTAHATAPNGRTDEDMGAVSVGGLRGDGLANATMKAITKAKRRVTLSICGLGLLDESEIETIPGAQVSIASAEPPRQLAPAPPKRQLPDDAPLSPKGRDVLLGLTEKLLGLTGQVVPVPEGLTNGEARDLHVAITDAIAAAEAGEDPAELASMAL